MGIKKRLLFVLPTLILSLIVAAYFIYLLSYVQPKIDFKAQITTVSTDDYQRILDNKQIVSQDKGIDKFRHVRVEIKVTTPVGPELINSVNIERDLLHQYLENDDRIQILGGGEFEHSNGKEYVDNIEIYLKDISEEQLRTKLKDLKVKVTWLSIWNGQGDRSFYLGDYLK